MLGLNGFSAYPMEWGSPFISFQFLGSLIKLLYREDVPTEVLILLPLALAICLLLPESVKLQEIEKEQGIRPWRYRLLSLLLGALFALALLLLNKPQKFIYFQF